MTPTEMAEQSFERAIHHFRRIDDEHMSFGLQLLTMGLQQLAIGVRATYQATDRVRQSVDGSERRVSIPS